MIVCLFALCIVTTLCAAQHLSGWKLLSLPHHVFIIVHAAANNCQIVMMKLGIG